MLPSYGRRARMGTSSAALEQRQIAAIVTSLARQDRALAHEGEGGLQREERAHLRVVLIGFEATGAVEQPSARRDHRRRVGEQLSLEALQGSETFVAEAPARLRPAREHRRVRAGSIHEN